MTFPSSSIAKDSVLKVCAVAAFSVAIILAFLNSYLYDWPTGDEYWHFGYSQRMIREGVIERETVHNYNSPTPFVALNVLADQYATNLAITSGFDKVIARLPSVCWFILLLVLSYAVPRYLFRSSDIAVPASTLRRIATWTALLTCLDQTLLGQGSHIGSDLPFAAMTLVYLAAMERYRRSPELLNAMLVGLVLGIAFNVKYSTTFLALFTIISLPVIRSRQAKDGQAQSRSQLLPSLGHLVTIGLIVTALVDAAYGFREIGLTFSTKAWYSAPFKTLADLIPNIPLPWPLPFIAGFDHQFAAERTWSWSSIVLGKEFPDGVWYYFPVVWLVKSPLPILATLALTLCQGMIRCGELKRNRPFMMTFALYSTLLLYFCFVFRTQVGIRYTLMCIPLGYVMAGYILATGLQRAEQAFLSAFLLIGVGIEAAPYVGNTLSFTNSIVTDKAQAYGWITDSNVDWFHNYSRGRALANAKLGNYFFNPRHLLPGDNVFTINSLAGVMRNYSQHAWIRNNLTPSGTFGNTLIWFHADQSTFDRFMNEARTYTQPQYALDICTPDRVYQPLVNGTSTALPGSWASPSLYTACLKVSEPTVIQLEVTQGFGAFGSYPDEGNCLGDDAGRGETLWFKLLPGVHPICARISEPATARWTVHQGRVALALRNQ
ncbi:MAG: hypothetical protein U0136_21335 [Bdellovibrionota bacterium]